MWIVFFVLLPVAVIIGGILYFNIYMRKRIISDTTPKPQIDQAYLEAEQTSADDADFGSIFGKHQSKKE